MLTQQSSHIVIDCPVCARPLEMKLGLVSHEVSCAHCRGEFAVDETDEGSFVAVNPRGTDSLKRAELLLRATGDTDLSGSERCCSPSPMRDGQPLPGDSLNTLSKDAKCEKEPLPTLLLVEYRDEIFARIATDLAEFGVRVIRAKTATEALHLVETHKPVLLVGNVDLPGQSGWLMTAKLRLFDHRTRVWLYRHQSSGYGQEIAKSLDIDVLLAHHGDLFGLSQTIVDRMANRHKTQQDDSNDIDQAEESTAA